MSKKDKPNKEYVKAMQELRRSSATTPVPSGKKYKRKSKHKDQYSRPERELTSR